MDFTIAATGGDITGATLTSSLADNNVVIQSTTGTHGGSAGDVNVNDAVSWSANQLTLNAQNNININANLNATGTASLALEFGQAAVAAGNTSNIITKNGAAVNLPASTTNFTTKQGSDGVVKEYTVITSLGAAGITAAADLQGMKDNFTLNYALGANIDATATSTWNSTSDVAAGFAPIGGRYTGTFDGLGHTISNLTINLPSNNSVGLFSELVGATVRNVGLVGGSVMGNQFVGALVGRNFDGSISNSYATGAVTGTNYTGGLIGDSNNGLISNSYATGQVAGSDYVGGLVGHSAGPGTVNTSYATGAVTGSNSTGGLVGYNASTISNSYASGAVTGNWGTGGLVGNSDSGTISNSYATGPVTGTGFTGGLLGFSVYATISNSYATGPVTGTEFTGGLVGFNLEGVISNSYATGAVTGVDYTGGLVGINDFGTISNSYWNSDAAAAGVGGGDSPLTGGLTTAQMKNAASFSPAWDMADTWIIFEDHSAPLLRSFLTALTITVNDASKTYDGLAYAGTPGVTYSVTPNGHLLGTLSYTGGGTNAGTSTITGSGQYSDQQGYIVNYVNGTLTINALPSNGVPSVVATAIAALPGGFNPNLLTNYTTIGLYVASMNGLINPLNLAGSLNFAAGQFGYTPSVTSPPTIVPTNPGIQFTPPPAFTTIQNGGIKVPVDMLTQE